MSKTIVALDLETTGLEAKQDAIIEIGAVRFKGDRVEGEFATLVNPGRKIPANVTQLTGITDAMVAKAPLISVVLPQLEEFVGEAPVLGHNIKFDLDFLQAKRALRYNDALDTLDLASVLLPSAGRYNLTSLAKELGVPTPSETMHRADVDARVTMEIYRALFRKALELPLDLLAEIVQLGQDIIWGAGMIFEDALRARAKEKVGARRVRQGAGGPLFTPANREDLRPLQRNPEMAPLDIDEIAAVLEPAGSFSHHFPHFEYRSEQVEMLRAVARAFSDGRHLLVEAGTGTGKSVGYLIPAIQWAVQNGERVIVSTNTINLQDQLINKDIPDLQVALGVDFRATVLKGRGNYLCPRRVENMRRHRPKLPEEMRVLAKVLVWLNQMEETGATTELSLGPNERGAWMRLSAEDEGCSADMCQSKMGGACPFYQAHKAAHAAHVVIVNHALLFADIASENRVLPDYRYLIVDEAHHLESATTDGLSFELSRMDFERQLKDLGGPNAGLLGEILAATRDVLTPELFATLDAEVNKAYDRATTALELSRDFFIAVETFMQEVREGQPISEYGQQVRIISATRTLTPWEQIEVQWEQVGQTLIALAKTLTRLAAGLTELEDFDLPERDDLVSAANAAQRRFADIVEKLNGFVFKPDPMTIYWSQVRGDGLKAKVSLHAAPLHVGQLVQKYLWHAKESVVMTSATLTTAGDFTYLKSRLTADEADEMAVGSPFDYETSTLLYLVNDIPEPVDKYNYQKMVEQGLIKLCTATRGRALVLFTSYAQLKQTAQAIRDPLGRAGIDVYDQSDGTARTTLLDSFKSSEGGVLLGTKSFWEGVDVVGEALSVLVIVKLPFDVPSDPIIAARSETFERAFDEYTVPEAVLKFRQGFGRLIRSKSDRGVVAIFDRRMLTKQYGRIFMDSLPQCTRKAGPMAGLPPLAAKWIDGG
jgi:DNA polymerase-3 subunit epsilon/ATP-dependent DNA helicase DinG